MNKLQALVKTMQRRATAFLVPEDYQDRNGVIWSDEKNRMNAFINDIIYLLDGPEQREAEAEVDTEREDLRELVRSLMRDLRVVDHIVTLNKGLPEQRTIVASKLMS
jgi:hypothetical protein